MVELLRGLLPTALVVATGAVFAQGLFVLVVLGVAAEAVERRLAHAGQVLVAGLAPGRGSGVRVAQRKFRATVVKAGRLPLLLAVAIGAWLPQRRVVLVVLLVAGKAVLGRLLEHRALVAFLALGLGVLAQQRKA